MKVNNSETRWELIQFSIKDGSFTVFDKLAKKRHLYHVPYLLHAEIVQQVVYVFTSNSKIMQLNLLTATRQFLSATQLKYLTQVQKIHKSLGFKETADKKLKHPLINIEHLPKYAFSNTVHSY
jgi:hypothetical protein